MDEPTKTVQPPILRFLFAGSVDDGKSTLMGRLFYDAQALPEDQIKQVAQFRTLSANQQPDFSLFTDGLAEERKLGVTIDVAYRYFQTAHRKFIVADTPGHFQYMRNMFTGASTADLVVFLLDVREGLVAQTHRHMYLAHLLQIPNWVLCMNKMDLVGYRKHEFEQKEQEVRRWVAQKFGRQSLEVLPISALYGDNVVDRSMHMSWYDGRTLLEALERTPLRAINTELLRFSVQLDAKPSETNNTRSQVIFGRVDSGILSVGDHLELWPEKRMGVVESIFIGQREFQQASAGMSVGMRGNWGIPMRRGHYLTNSERPFSVSRSPQATLCWLSEVPCNFSNSYLMKQGHSLYPITLQWVFDHEMSLFAPKKRQDSQVRRSENDIFDVRIMGNEGIIYDLYSLNRTTGSFILMHEDSFETCAAGFFVTNEQQGIH